MSTRCLPNALLRLAIVGFVALRLGTASGRAAEPSYPYPTLAAAFIAAGFDPAAPGRSEERRVGKECGLLCRSRWSPYH